MGIRDVAVRAAGTAATTSGQVNPGRGHNVDTTEFDTEVITFDAMPTQFAPSASDPTAESGAAGDGLARRHESGRPGGSVARRQQGESRPPRRTPSPMIAEGVRTLTNPRRSGGKVVERRLAWLATAADVTVVTAEQELVPTAGGKFRRSGEWWLTRRQVFTPSATPVTKPGRVPVDDIPDDAQDTSAPAARTVAEADRYLAEMALASLPAPVRASVLARVPNPTIFEGSLVKIGNSEGDDRYEVSLLRIDSNCAAVVTAGRSANATHWDVTYRIYHDVTESVQHG